MVRTTETSDLKKSDLQLFYDELAEDYDNMTSFEGRIISERPFFRLFVEKHKIVNAIDAGCGTGTHSVLLAQLGVRVVAVDVSSEMLQKVRDHAKQFGVNIDTIQASFEEIPKNIPTEQDALFCLGNSLAHLLSDKELIGSLRSFKTVLKPEGYLFLQILNYEKILEKRERIQSIRESDNITYVRFYDYSEENLKFNILTIDQAGEDARHSLQSIDIKPLKRNDFVGRLNELGFKDIQIYGSISLKEFDPLTSRDLVIIAKK